VATSEELNLAKARERYFPYFVFEMTNELSLRYSEKVTSTDESLKLIYESIEANIFELYPLSNLRFPMESYMEAIKQQTDTEDFNPMGLTINPTDKWLIFVDEEGMLKPNNLNMQASQFFGSHMFGNVMVAIESDVEVEEISLPKLSERDLLIEKIKSNVEVEEQYEDV
tara:strand:- start:10569 stop:11075 length:507 start_codon:yes stop_codon:yes gene_type:complete